MDFNIINLITAFNRSFVIDMVQNLDIILLSSTYYFVLGLLSCIGYPFSLGEI